MKLSKCYSQLETMIGVLATQYYQSVRMEKEDLIQDLWVHAIEKDFDNLAIAYTSLKNRCNRIYHNNVKSYSARNFNVYSFSFTDFDESYIASESDDFLITTITQSLDNDIALASVLKILNDKSYQYVVLKAYLSGNFPDLKEKYLYIVSNANLTFEQIKTLESLKYNDDFIARYVFGYKGGSVSGSFKNIRKTLKKTFKDLCIY